MIKVGVIGTGAMGQHHARIYSSMDNVDLVGVADIDQDRVTSLAGEYKTRAFTDHRLLLDEELDAVSIAVPTVLHREVALDAIDRGVHVLLEKPIADSLKSADEIIRGAGSKGVKVMVGHIERFNPVVLKLKEVIDSGNLGKVVAMSTTRVGPYNPRIRDVGIITDLAVHDIDIMSYLYSERVRSVHAYAGSVIHKFEDYACILLGFNNGNSGIIETNWLTPHKIRRLTVTGTEGIAYADYISQSLKICDERGEIEVKIVEREPLMNELEHFVECVVGGREPLVTARDGRYALEVAIAAIDSYKGYKTVMVCPE
ncbi:MAG: UDP-N-acetylglucosamine 3-dehydrogenase [Candidatus Altiarchaeota archaeon]|nr:UDP-N-acetylglucosamine 3-dehydrogenase [Candidatus Altiarchaeota archaeon]